MSQNPGQSASHKEDLDKDNKMIYPEVNLFAGS